MTITQSISSQIQAKLSADIDSLLAEVKEIPETPDEYTRTVAKSTIWAVINGIKPKAESASDYLRQETTYTVEVIITSRTFTGDGGIYQLNDLVVKSLGGYVMDGMSRITYTQSQHNGSKNHTISWSVFFRFDGYVIAQDADDTDGDGANLVETILDEEIPS